MAAYLKGPDTLEAAEHLLNQVDVGTLASTISGRDELADKQRLLCVEKLFGHESICQRFQPVVCQLFGVATRKGKGAAAPASPAEELVPVLELFLRLQSAQNRFLLLKPVFEGEWFWLLTGDSIKVAELATELVCADGVWNRVSGIIPKLGQVVGEKCGGGATTAGAYDDIVRFRFLHLVSELAARHECVVPNGFAKIAESFFTEDILVKLNAIEVFQTLNRSTAGQRFLFEEAGLPERIANELADPMSSSLDPRIAPICVLFLSHVIRQRPDPYLGKFFDSVLLPLLTEFVHSSPVQYPLHKFTVVRVVGELGQLPDWKFLGGGEVGSPARGVFEFAKEAVLATNEELQKVSLTAWIAITDAYPQRAAVILEHVLRVLREKGAEPRPFCYQFLANAARSEEMAMFIIQSDQIRNLLLDFGSETTHDARVEKHRFAKELVQRRAVRNLLEREAFDMLQAYVDKGPYNMTIVQERVAVGSMGGH